MPRCSASRCSRWRSRAIMRRMDEYAKVNREFWDERVPAHAASPDYGVARFAEDPAFLSEVVRFDRPRLGDLTGLEGVHLQCHIGTDTVSLTRLGARMTGPGHLAAGARRGTRAGRGRGCRRDVRRVRGLLGRRGAGRRAVRPRLHRRRRALLAARHPPLGGGRRRAAAAGRPAAHPRRPPDAVGAGRRPRGRAACRSSTRTSRRPTPSSGTRATRGRPTSRRTSSSRRTSPTSGTTASARSSRRCWTRAWS